MKNKVSWKFLLGGAIVGYFLQYVIGGIIGNFCGVLALILLILGIIDLVRGWSKSSDAKKPSSDQ